MRGQTPIGKIAKSCVWGLTPLLILALVFVAFAAAASACPLCKEALFEPGQLKQRLATAHGYALSIGILLAMPATLIGAISFGIVRSIRRRRRTLDA